MKNTRLALTGLFALASTLAPAPANADAGDLAKLKDTAKDVGKFATELKGTLDALKSAASSAQQKVEAKKTRMQAAVKGLQVFADALKDGNPLPLYFTKADGAETLKCGDKVWVQSTANDRALVSEPRKDGSNVVTRNTGTAFAQVNLGFVPFSDAKSRFPSGPNVTIQCKDKQAGQPFNYGDDFVFKVDFYKGLDDGKPMVFPCDNCKWEPRVRMESLSEVIKRNDWFEMRMSEMQGKPVQTGIPSELIATNRGEQKDGNLGGYCAVGAWPVVSLAFGNQCNHVQLALILTDQKPALPPQWLTDRGNEVMKLAREIKAELGGAVSGNGGGSGNSSTTPTTPKPAVIPPRVRTGAFQR